jgi:hypothetical protein
MEVSAQRYDPRLRLGVVTRVHAAVTENCGGPADDPIDVEATHNEAIPFPGSTPPTGNLVAGSFRVTVTED